MMIYVSFVDLLAVAQHTLAEALGESMGTWLATGAFFGGILVIGLIDRLIPSYENPHEAPAGQKRLMRMGVLAAIAIAVHNFPEGMATFISVLSDPAIGVSIAIAIAIHNIPEGIAVSVPVFFATGSRKKAFWLSFLSGLSEPLGALIGYLLLRSFLTDTTLGVLFTSVAGVMVFISLDELFPAAREYGRGHLAIYGLIAGMAVMAVSLLLL